MIFFEMATTPQSSDQGGKPQSLRKCWPKCFLEMSFGPIFFEMDEIGDMFSAMPWFGTIFFAHSLTTSGQTGDFSKSQRFRPHFPHFPVFSAFFPSGSDRILSPPPEEFLYPYHHMQVGLPTIC